MAMADALLAEDEQRIALGSQGLPPAGYYAVRHAEPDIPAKVPGNR
jgi:hypothetical protein